jgi:signal transduction histidine kinase
VLKVTVPREITTQGREAMHFAAQSLMFAGLITLLVQMGLLRWLVLMPLDRITRHAVHVGRTDDLTDPINLQRRDELGVLATEFNRMMERLAQARVAMADATYRAGVAEMASGVLHNVGNALTPIGVKATVLRQRLEATPIAELDIALTELDGGGGDSARRADLESFLRLATRELATSARAAAATSEEIAAQVNAIQTILAQQSVLSRASHVAEPVRVDALVEQAARLVPADRRERLTVVVDPSVREVGVVRAARIAVQQVFQNLIQNACEAMRPGQRGTLTIRAALDSAAGSPELRVVFADDGAGIARENLGRIFDKGFSTKATATNSGIGLHWSANVLNALGGRIVAESGGPGRGAVMTVVLPLETPAAGKLEAAA